MKRSRIPPITRSCRRQLGFTLIEMLMAIVILLVGIVAIAQLVPASVGSNATNRNDSSALVFAQRELNEMLSQPINFTSFTDSLGNTCNLGDPTQPNQTVGSAVLVSNNQPVINFGAVLQPSYSFTYQDPNDPYGVTYDVRWAVITATANGVIVSKRFILGARKVGGNGYYAPVTIDTMEWR